MAAKVSKGTWPQEMGKQQATACATQLGTVVAMTDDWVPYVSYDDSQGPVRALSVTPAPAVSSPQELVGRSVLLALPAPGPGRKADKPEPVIVGFLQPDIRPANRPQPEPPPSEPATLPVEVHLDGKQVQIQAQEELVLRCGRSRIVLQKDGRIVVRGEEITSRASGSNKIRGATVRLN